MHLWTLRTERNVSAWSSERLRQLLLGLRVEGPEGACQLTDVNKLDGEASINNRKGKLIFFYEWQLRASWLGTSGGGVKYRGTIEVSNLSDENDLDDLDISVSLCKDQPDTPLLDLMRRTGVPEVRRILGEYVHQLKSEFSQGMILPTANGPKLPAPEPSKKNQIKTSKTQISSTPRCSSSPAPCPTGVRIPTCSFNLTETFQTSADELYWTFVNQEFVQVFTRSAAVVDGCRGGRFQMLDGSVSGEFTQLVPDQRIEMRWRFRTWPSEHYATVSLELEDRGDETELRMECRGVPVGEEDSTREGWNRFYFQAIKQTFGNAVMFNNEQMADVHFIVGPPGETQRVPAHKYVLAVGSSVFGAMFYGDLAEGQSEIHIPDVEPAAFLILLKYMYSDEIELEADTVLATLYAAKKYIVPALAKACVTFLETSLEAKNACVLLSQSRLFEEPELTQRCWEVIDAQAELALRSEGFCEIDLPTLEIILQRETLNIREVVVFQAVLSWAAAECRRQGLAVTPMNQRAVLGKTLYLVRIPSMTLQEFADGTAQSDVLTLKETRDVFLWFTATNKPRLEFSLGKRAGLVPQRCHRFQSSAYRSNQWRYRGRCDSIQFAVDRRIFMAGLGLYGSSSGKAEYSVKIELKRQGTVLAQNFTQFLSDGSSSTFPVWFEHPVQVEQDTFYTVSVVLDGNELSYFGQEGMTEVQCGKVTFQFQCSSDSTNGTGVQGGQIPELVFYC
ncbi:BTB/POZ domain-containing protein 6-B-like protein [Lates japonicus]|uniref:BTB/POZ domain-containing protein 6-B-like protein n=1 Tax=Lates japonicus TaxID=270547 RepID=A0AAD3NJ79_LATJO|nr:BTB/POZ domain-containing protein 6-B-like protein [Lates japonicus]